MHSDGPRQLLGSTVDHLEFGARFQLGSVSVKRHARNLRTTPRHSKNQTDTRHEFYYHDDAERFIFQRTKADKVAQTAV